MLTLGIDPGVNGGLAVIDTDSRKVIVTMRMPIIVLDGKSRPDVVRLQGQLGELAIGRVVLERSLTRPGESGAAGLSIGASWGMLLAWVLLAQYPVRSVTPTVWTKRLFGKAYDGKQTTIDWCRATYPGADLVGSAAKNAKAHDGICDAIAIAHYGAGIP